MSYRRADEANWTVWTALAAAYDAFRDNYIPLVATTLIWLVPAIGLDALGVNYRVVIAVELFIGSFLMISLAPAAAESLLDHPVRLRDCLMHSLHCLRPGALILAVLQLAGVLLGLALLILPGLYLLSVWSVASAGFIPEGRRPMAALRRSLWLTRGRVMRIMLTLVLFILIAVILSSGFRILLAVVPDFNVTYGRLVVWVVDAMFISLSACLTTVIYCLLRFDKEGTTLELVTASLHPN